MSIGPQRPQGSTRAKRTVKSDVYKALVAGDVLSRDGIKARLFTKRRANNAEEISARHVRGVTQKTLKEIGEGVEDTSVREYRGGELRGDTCKTLQYLIPTYSAVTIFWN